MIKKVGMNNRHKKFAQEYLKDFNATRAYRTAYPTVKSATAGANGAKLLKNTKVQQYLSEMIHQTKIKDIMEIDEVLSKISEIASGKPRDKTFKRTSYDHEKGKKEIEFDTVTTSQPEDEDQLKALELMGRYYKIFLELSNPELDKAKIRKANADARVAEARAKTLEDNGQDVEKLLDKMIDTLDKADEKDGDK